MGAGGRVVEQPQGRRPGCPNGRREADADRAEAAAAGRSSPVQVSDVLKKSSGFVPANSVRRTRSASPPVFWMLRVAKPLIVLTAQFPISATSPVGNCRSGHGVVLSSTDTVFVAGPAEFAARTSGRPSSLKSADRHGGRARPDRPGAVDAIELRPPASPPRKTRAMPSVSAPAGSKRLHRAEEVALRVGVEAPDREPHRAEDLAAANSSCSSTWKPPPPVPSSTIGSSTAAAPGATRSRWPSPSMSPDTIRPPARDGDGVAAPNVPVPQPEAQQAPGAMSSSPSSSKSSSTDPFATVPGSAAFGRAEAVPSLSSTATLIGPAPSSPAVADHEVARVVVVQPPGRDHDRRVAAARDRLERR